MRFSIKKEPCVEILGHLRLAWAKILNKIAWNKLIEFFCHFDILFPKGLFQAILFNISAHARRRWLIYSTQCSFWCWIAWWTKILKIRKFWFFRNKFRNLPFTFRFEDSESLSRTNRSRGFISLCNQKKIFKTKSERTDHLRRDIRKWNQSVLRNYSLQFID